MSNIYEQSLEDTVIPICYQITPEISWDSLAQPNFVLAKFIPKTTYKVQSFVFRSFM